MGRGQQYYKYDECPHCGNRKWASSKTCNLCRWGSLQVRFNSRYCINLVTGCWEWTAGKQSTFGYGMISLDRKRGTTAHRVSWMLFRGPIPEGMFVCHKCDNPPCVNPDHLFLGTQQDNMTDKVRKNRHLPGERHPGAKLTADQVRAIRLDNRNRDEIARDYSMTRSSIEKIQLGQTWRSVK